MTVSINRSNAAGFSVPTVRTTIPALAVKSFPGRAKLAVSNPPLTKSFPSRAIADGSAYELLVTWHKIQSPRPAEARHTAGRNFD
jgi:hypothetical protein